MRAALATVAMLLAITHPAVLTAGLGEVLAVLDVAATVITHPLLLLIPELAFIAFMCAAIARSAGVTFSIPWRVTEPNDELERLREENAALRDLIAASQEHVNLSMPDGSSSGGISWTIPTAMELRQADVARKAMGRATCSSPTSTSP